MTTTHTEPSLGQRLLQEGQQLLAQGDRAGAAQVLARARDEQDTVLAAHALIECYDLVGSFANMTGLNCSIAPHDDIFGFFAGHPSSRNPLRDYLADGWRTLSELMLLLEAVDQPLLKTPCVLEFASGHGRFTRHLVKALGADRVVVSDVVPDAVEFSRRTFGVEGFMSASVPEQVQWPQRYELVFVLSLFSHLPRRPANRTRSTRRNTERRSRPKPLCCSALPKLVGQMPWYTRHRCTFGTTRMRMCCADAKLARHVCAAMNNQAVPQ